MWSVFVSKQLSHNKHYNIKKTIPQTSDKLVWTFILFGKLCRVSCKNNYAKPFSFSMAVIAHFCNETIVLFARRSCAKRVHFFQTWNRYARSYDVIQRIPGNGNFWIWIQNLCGTCRDALSRRRRKCRLYKVCTKLWYGFRVFFIQATLGLWENSKYLERCWDVYIVKCFLPRQTFATAIVQLKGLCFGEKVERIYIVKEFILCCVSISISFPSSMFYLC